MEVQLTEIREDIRFRKFSATLAREAFSQMIEVESHDYIDLSDVALTAKGDYLEPEDMAGDNEQKLGEMFVSY